MMQLKITHRRIWRARSWCGMVCYSEAMHSWANKGTGLISCKGIEQGSSWTCSCSCCPQCQCLWVEGRGAKPLAREEWSQETDVSGEYGEGCSTMWNQKLHQLLPVMHIPNFRSVSSLGTGDMSARTTVPTYYGLKERSSLKTPSWRSRLCRVLSICESWWFRSA